MAEIKWLGDEPDDTPNGVSKRKRKPEQEAPSIKWLGDEGEEDAAPRPSPVAAPPPEKTVGLPSAKPGKKSTFVESAVRMGGQMVQGHARTAEALGLPTEPIQDFGEAVAQANPSSITSLKDLARDPGQAVKETGGELVPQMGENIVTSRLGGGLGALIGGRFGGLPGAEKGYVIGDKLLPYAMNYSQELGQILESQDKNGTKDLLTANVTAAAAAALDTWSPVDAYGRKLAKQGLGKTLKLGVDKLATTGAYDLFEAATKTGLKTIGIDAAKEGITEPVQSFLERIGGHEPVTGSEALDDYGISLFKGMVGGAGISAGSQTVDKIKANRVKLDPNRQTGNIPPETEPGNDRSDVKPAQPQTQPQGGPRAPLIGANGRYNVDEILDRGVGPQESGGQKNAVSPKGALGKYQLLPATALSVATRLGLDTSNFEQRVLTDDNYNRTIAKAYLQEMLTKYNGDMFLALTAYHGGPRNTDKWIAKYGYDPANPQGFVEGIAQGNPASAKYAREVMGRLGQNVRSEVPDLFEGSVETPAGPDFAANPLDTEDGLGDMDLGEGEVLKFLRTNVDDEVKASPTTTALGKAIAAGDEQATAAIAKERDELAAKLEKLINDDQLLGDGSGMQEGQVARAKISINRRLKLLQARERALGIAEQTAERAARQRARDAEGGVQQELFDAASYPARDAPVADQGEPLVAPPAPPPAAPAAPTVGDGINLVTEPADPNAGYPVGRRAPFPSEVQNPGPGALPAVNAADTVLAEQMRREDQEAQSQALGNPAATAQARQSILEDILKDPATHSPRKRFEARLKRAGLDTQLSQDEADALDRYKLQQLSRGVNPLAVMAQEALVRQEEEAKAADEAAKEQEKLAREAEKQQRENERQARLDDAAAQQAALPQQDTTLGVKARPEPAQAAPEPTPQPTAARTPEQNILDRAEEQAAQMGSSQAAWFMRGVRQALGDETIQTPPGKDTKVWFKQGTDFVTQERTAQEREAGRAGRTERRQAERKGRDAAIAASKARQPAKETLNKERVAKETANREKRAAQAKPEKAAKPQPRKTQQAIARSSARSERRASAQAEAQRVARNLRAREQRAAKAAPPPAPAPPPKTTPVTREQKLAAKLILERAAQKSDTQEREADEQARADFHEKVDGLLPDTPGEKGALTQQQAVQLRTLADMKESDDPASPYRFTMKDLNERLAFALNETTKASQTTLTRRGFAGVLAGLSMTAAQAGARTNVSDNAAVTKALQKGDLTGVIQAIMQTTKNPQYRELARSMLLGGFAKNAKIEVWDLGDVELALLGVTDTGTGNVKIFHTAAPVTGLSEETILHEALHSWLAARYSDISLYSLRREIMRNPENAKTYAKELDQKQEAEQFIAAFKELHIDFALAMAKANPELLDRDSEAVQQDPWAYIPSRDADEFFVRMFTDPRLQQWLRTHDKQGNKIRAANPTSFWSRLMRMIRSLFGLKPPSTSLLSIAMDSGWSVIKAGTLDPKMELSKATADAQFLAYGHNEGGRQMFTGGKPEKASVREGSIQAAAAPGPGLKAMQTGVLSKRADMNTLAKAKAALKNGMSADEVLKRYGWRIDPNDGKAKFEIDDSKATLTPAFENLQPDQTMRLGDALVHPELFKAYPHLADMPVVRQERAGYNGWFDGKEIGVAPNIVGAKGTLLHEIQHAVQLFEGFAGGGNWQQFNIRNVDAVATLRTHYERRVQERQATIDQREKDGRKPSNFSIGEVNRLKAKIAELDTIAPRRGLLEANEAELRLIEDEIAKLEAQDDDLKAKRDATISSKIRDDIAAQRKALKETIRGKNEQRITIKDKVRWGDILPGNVGSALYRLLAGEIEARDTQARSTMTMDERRETPPGWQEDILPSERITTFGLPGGIKASATRLPPVVKVEDIPDPQTLDDAYANLPPPFPNNALQRGKRTLVEKTANFIESEGKNLARNGDLFIAGTKEIAETARKYMPSIDDLIELQSQAHSLGNAFMKRLHDIRDVYFTLPAKLRGNEPGSVNEFIHDMNRWGKWGFEPDYHTKGVPVLDKGLVARFEAMKAKSPNAAAVIQAVFRFNYDARLNLKDAVSKAINAEYDPLIAAADDKVKDAKGRTEKDRMETRKEDAFKFFSRAFDTREGVPYSPMSREGNWIVVGKSPEYRAAEQAKDQAAIDRMRADPKHLFVDMRDTVHEAALLAKDVATQMGKENVDHFERGTAQADAAFASDNMHLAFKRMQTALAAEADKGSHAAKEMYRLATDLYLHSLSEQSARKSELRKENVPARNPFTGEVPDMVRIFVTRSMTTVNYISSLTNNPKIMAALTRMQEETNAQRGVDRTKAAKMHGEVTYRYTAELGKQPNRLVDAAARTVSVMMLLLSPAYFIINGFQTPVITQTRLAAKWGYPQSMAQIGRGMIDFYNMTKDIGLLDRVDFAKHDDPEIAAALKYLADHGHLDAGLSGELGSWQVNGNGVVPFTVNKIDMILRRFPERVEVWNRVTAGIAAYRLARGKGRKQMSVEDAQKYAGEIIDQTHGDYSGFNSPRPFHWGGGGFGKIALQFRKFQGIMLAMMKRELKRTFAGATAEEKFEGARALAFVGAHTLAVGGLAGTFGANVLGPAAMILLNMIDDDDDDKDWGSNPLNWRHKLRTTLGAAQPDASFWDKLMYKGAPYALGLDTSDRMGMGNTAALAPYSGINEAFDSSQKMNEVTGKMVAGAAGGVVGKAINGWGFATTTGEWERFWEGVAPKGITDVMKAIRFGKEGLVNKKGDTLIPKEGITMPEKVMVGLGFTPSKLANQAEIASETFEVKEYYDNQTTMLKNRYSRADERGDDAAKKKVVDEFWKVQGRRVKDGLPRQKISVLRDAVKEKRKRSRQIIGGVMTDKTTRGFVRPMVEMEEPAEP